jgi:hypothetical protein
MYKLARNPLLDRPVSFRSYTFDATPLLRMRQEQRRRASSPGAQEPTRRKPSAASTAQNTFWKSSKINSRIKTCISTNGTIKERNYSISMSSFGGEVMIFSVFFLAPFKTIQDLYVKYQ